MDHQHHLSTPQLTEVEATHQGQTRLARLAIKTIGYTQLETKTPHVIKIAIGPFAINHLKTSG
jgi:hypothetical protein